MDITTIGLGVDTSKLKAGTKELDNFGRSADKAAGKADGLTGSTQKLGKESSLAAVGLGKMGVALGAALSVAGIALFIKEITILNARYNELGIVMNQVGKNAGFTADKLDEQELALRKTGISMLESRASIAKLISANIDLAKATDLARLAQNTATIGGVNSSEAFARLVDGIQTAQVETLRTLGINVNFENSYKKLASQLGKTTDDLSEYEKTQARVNATLAVAPSFANLYEESMNSASKQIRSATRYIEDLKVKLGAVFSETLTVSVMAFTATVKDANGEIDQLAEEGRLKKWGEHIVKEMLTVDKAITGISIAFQLANSHINEFIALRSSGFSTALGGGSSKAIKDAAEQERAEIAKTTSAFRNAVNEREKALKDAAKKKDPFLEAMAADNAKNMADLRKSEDLKAERDLEASKKAGELAKQLEKQREQIIKSIAIMELENSLIKQNVSLQDAKTIAQLKSNGATDAMIVSMLNATNAQEKLIENIKIEEEFYADFEKAIVSQEQALDSQTESIFASAQALEDENSVYGKLQFALTDVTIARLRDKQAMLESLGLVVPEIEAQIKAYERLRNAQFKKEDLDKIKKLEDERVKAAEKANDEILKEHEKTVDGINQVFREGFAGLINGGKGSWKAFTKSLITTFKTTVADQIYKMLAQPFIVKLIASVMGISVSGTAAAGTVASAAGSQGLFAMGKSLFEGVTSGFQAMNQSYFSGISAIGKFFSDFGSTGQGFFTNAASDLGSSIHLGAESIGEFLPYAGALLQLAQGNIKGAAFTAGGTYIGNLILPGIGGVIGGFLGSMLSGLFGGKKIPLVGSQAKGIFEDGKYTGTTAKFGKRDIGAQSSLETLNKAFAEQLSTLLKAFDLNNKIIVKSIYRTRTNARGFFGASGEGFDFYSQVYKAKAKRGDINKFFEKVLGATLVKAIQLSKLPDGIKSLFDGMTKKENVSKMIQASIDLQAAQKQLASQFGITVDQSAKAAKATGLVGDALIAYMGKLSGKAVAFMSVGEIVTGAKTNLAAAFGEALGTVVQDVVWTTVNKQTKQVKTLVDRIIQSSIKLPETLKEYDLLIKGLDKTTERGLEQFNELFGMRDQFVAFISSIAQLKSGVQAAIFGMSSDAEQQAMMNADLAKIFSELNIGVPRSIQELIALGKSIDFTTKEGLDLAAVFPSLVSAFQQTQDAVDDLINSLDPNRFKTIADFKLAQAYTSAGMAIPSTIASSSERILPALNNAVIPSSNNSSRTDSSLTQTLIDKVERLGQAIEAVALHTYNTAKTLSKFDGDGMPPVRTA